MFLWLKKYLLDYWIYDQTTLNNEHCKVKNNEVGYTEFVAVTIAL
jgi:hypothetical protein